MSASPGRAGDDARGRALFASSGARLAARAAGAAALVLASSACRKSPPPPATLDPASLNPQRALGEVCDFVALGPRVSGTEGSARAAAYLADRLRALRIEPIVDEFAEATPRGRVLFRNVMGVVPGTSARTIILVSHYDTKGGIPGFVGANDSGSSTGLLLELARGFRAGGPWSMDLLFVFVDGEECAVEYGPEDGLHGSRQLVRTLVRNNRADNVAAVLVLDMIGDRDLGLTIPRNSTPRLASVILQASHDEGVRERFGLGNTMLDDHVPFLARGIPAVDLIDFAYGSAPGLNDYWHTPADTVDKLSAESLGIVGRVVIRSINHFLSAPVAPVAP